MPLNRETKPNQTKQLWRMQSMTRSFVCFVLRHINLIGHLMPNQVKENKSEKKFKGEVLELMINFR